MSHASQHGSAAPIAPTCAEMERLKRRLDAVPGLLGGPGPVRLCGLPAPDDVEGALRLEGVVALLSAQLRPIVRGGTAPAIWLGGDLGEVPDGPGPVLLWPPGDAGDPLLAAAAARAGRTARLVLPPHRAPPQDLPPGLASVALPEPAHALWGLLDHHPRGEGVLALHSGRGWAELLPASRIEAARRLGRPDLPLGPLPGLARRRLVEAARRTLAAHAAVATDRLGASLFAALLGRPVHARGAAVAAYWRTLGTPPGAEQAPA